MSIIYNNLIKLADHIDNESLERDEGLVMFVISEKTIRCCISTKLSPIQYAALFTEIEKWVNSTKDTHPDIEIAMAMHKKAQKEMGENK